MVGGGGVGRGGDSQQFDCFFSQNQLIKDEQKSPLCHGAENLTEEVESFLFSYIGNLENRNSNIVPNDRERRRLSCNDIQYSFPQRENFSSLND